METLPYFSPKMVAFNINWHERPKRWIDSYIEPKGTLTKPGIENIEEDHSDGSADINLTDDQYHLALIMTHGDGLPRLSASTSAQRL